MSTERGDNRLPALAEEISKAHADVQDAEKTAAQRAIDAGHALIEAKALVAHGEWLPWLRSNVKISERSVQRYMALARSDIKSATVADLGLADAEQLVIRAFKLCPTKDRAIATGDENAVAFFWRNGDYITYAAVITGPAIEDCCLIGPRDVYPWALPLIHDHVMAARHLTYQHDMPQHEAEDVVASLSDMMIEVPR